MKAKKSAHIPPLTGSMPYLGSQSSVVQNNVTTDEDAMYALCAAIAADHIWNINKLTKTSTKYHHSTSPTHFSLHNEPLCPVPPLIDVSNHISNLQGIHDSEFCVDVVISTPPEIPNALKISNSDYIADQYLIANHGNTFLLQNHVCKMHTGFNLLLQDHVCDNTDGATFLLQDHVCIPTDFSFTLSVHQQYFDYIADQSLIINYHRLMQNLNCDISPVA